jgi:hypothetical protein
VETPRRLHLDLDRATHTGRAAIGIGLAALVICAVHAGLAPARRASHIDPLVAVRHE